jgi:L-ascorbate metabolism protein UlaG (beta-lactamase superfamily)
MDIVWHGLGSFSITGKPVAAEVTLVTDPYDNAVGLRFPRTLSASVVAMSNQSEWTSNGEAVAGQGDRKTPFLVEHAGEYEVAGIAVRGIAGEKKDGTAHTIFRIMLEGIKIAYLGSIDRKLTNEEIEALGNIDILILPVGGGAVLDAKTASSVVSQVEPRLIIPSHYDVKGVKEKFADVEVFCKEMACPREDQNKLKIKKSALPAEDMQLVVLARA